MFWTDLITGVILMLSGLMVYKFPMTISGINTMSKKSLAKLNVEGIKRVVRNAFLTGGAVLVLLGVLSTLVHFSEGVLVAVNSAMIIAVVFAMIVACVVLTEKYVPGTLEEDKEEKAKNEKRENRIAISVALGIFALMTFIFIYVILNTKK